MKFFCRRAKFIHQEFRRTGFVSAVQHFVIDGKEPKMVIKVCCKKIIIPEANCYC